MCAGTVWNVGWYESPLRLLSLKSPDASGY